MLNLLNIRLPSRVGPRIDVFGTYLLRDNDGNKMANIADNSQGKPESMAMEVLREWLAGKGVEVSWESLVATLKESGLSGVADDIQMTRTGDTRTAEGREEIHSQQQRTEDDAATMEGKEQEITVVSRPVG